MANFLNDGWRSQDVCETFGKQRQTINFRNKN
ncbi:MAG: hypothetical protein QG599_338 [Pseudomonadota bacterium]|nr:hypothetical protein [Pseudomonadota bacterium]